MPPTMTRRTCQQCGKPFLARLCIVRDGYGKFCGKKCFYRHRWQAPEERFFSNINKSGPVPSCDPSLGPCWLWTGRSRNGYGALYFYGRERMASAVSYELAHGQPIPDSRHVLHKCDNPPCVNPTHLYLGTPADNSRDKVSRGRQAWGEKIGVAKLSAVQVLDIRSLLEQGNTTTSLAKRFGVNQSTISRIKNGKRWGLL